MEAASERGGGVRDQLAVAAHLAEARLRQPVRVGRARHIAGRCAQHWRLQVYSPPPRLEPESAAAAPQLPVSPFELCELVTAEC